MPNKTEDRHNELFELMGDEIMVGCFLRKVFRFADALHCALLALRFYMAWHGPARRYRV